MWTKITKVIAIVWTWFMTNKAMQQVVVYELAKLAKKTDNKLDDAAVQMIADRLGVEIEQ